MSARDSLPRIDVELVRRLVAAQFSEWAALPIQPVAEQGHDNRTFRLGCYRGGDLAVYDAETRTACAALHAVVDTRAALTLWDEALSTHWRRDPAFVHGDVGRGNLLLAEGALCAVIDFGQLAAGDPACDLVIAWTWFSGASRSEFRARIALDSDTWGRARGWALWKALLTLERAGPAAAEARRVIEDLLDESRESRRVSG